MVRVPTSGLAGSWAKNNTATHWTPPQRTQSMNAVDCHVGADPSSSLVARWNLWCCATIALAHYSPHRAYINPPLVLNVRCLLLPSHPPIARSTFPSILQCLPGSAAARPRPRPTTTINQCVRPVVDMYVKALTVAVHQAEHKSSISHELIAGAASFEVTYFLEFYALRSLIGSM